MGDGAKRRHSTSAARRRRAPYFDSRRWSGKPRDPHPRGGHGIDPRQELATGDIFVPHDEYRTSTGQKVIHAQHHHRGLRVFRSSRVFKLSRGKSRATPPLYRLPKNLALQPDVSSVRALETAVILLQKRGLAAPGLRVSVLRETQLAHLAYVPAVVELRYGLRGPARMHLEILPPDEQAIRDRVGHRPGPQGSAGFPARRVGGRQETRGALPRAGQPLRLCGLLDS
jgi:hypothetical protein